MQGSRTRTPMLEATPTNTARQRRGVLARGGLIRRQLTGAWHIPARETGPVWHNGWLGRLGEDIAADYLRSRGYRILDRNWRGAAGELDVVARDGDQLVVCEVKTRTATWHGDPLDAITERKADRLRQLAGCWLAEHRGRLPEPRQPAERIRVDALGVLRATDGTTFLRHLPGIC
jgi:putative endonuclease